MPADFYVPSADKPLRQCEIVSDLKQLTPIPGAGWSDAPDIEIIDHPFAIVLSQDCDLEQDYQARFSEPPDLRFQIPSILFCQASLATQKREEPKIGNIWKQLTQNNLERFQYLAEVLVAEDARGAGFGPLVIDFRKYFSLPTADAYRQFELGATRRTVLKSPYLEQVSTRFAYY